MALPDDMQVVPVILLKSDARKAAILARGKRQSRSEYLRNLITEALAAFSVPTSSFDETEESDEEQVAA